MLLPAGIHCHRARRAVATARRTGSRCQTIHENFSPRPCWLHRRSLVAVVRPLTERVLPSILPRRAVARPVLHRPAAQRLGWEGVGVRAACPAVPLLLLGAARLRLIRRTHRRLWATEVRTPAVAAVVPSLRRLGAVVQVPSPRRSAMAARRRWAARATPRAPTFAQQGRTGTKRRVRTGLRKAASAALRGWSTTTGATRAAGVA